MIPLAKVEGKPKGIDFGTTFWAIVPHQLESRESVGSLAQNLTSESLHQKMWCCPAWPPERSPFTVEIDAPVEEELSTSWQRGPQFAHQPDVLDHGVQGVGAPAVFDFGIAARHHGLDDVFGKAAGVATEWLQQDGLEVRACHIRLSAFRKHGLALQQPL
jgi:hypothetical protein